ncbi:MAG: hypothetical protein KAV87_24305 [Desulfobacteraceae bacterium]|nr:hypothetical protein [Desulfobacteraceae bacterium]
MSRFTVAILSCLMTIFMVTTSGISGSEDFDFERILKSHPSSQKYVFDYVGVLEDI